MKSMTGFGSASVKKADLEISIDMTSINRRNLEISVSLPKEWQSLESSILTKIRPHLDRGKISIYVKATDYSHSDQLSWDEKNVNAIVKNLKRSAKQQRISFKMSSELLFDIIKASSKPSELPKPDVVESFVVEATGKALEKLISMRTKEGAYIKNDLKNRLEVLSKNVAAIKKMAPEIVVNYRKNLFKKLKEANVEIDLDDERVLKEIALFADRCDIAEEITRLESHIKQFTQELSSKDAIGRKLDFMCQEIHRELNTVGSKSTIIEIVRSVIESKNELERIREQVQNIE